MNGSVTQRDDGRAGSDDGDALLRMRGISKRFGATAALTDVGLTLRPGEVHALAP